MGAAGHIFETADFKDQPVRVGKGVAMQPVHRHALVGAADDLFAQPAENGCPAVGRRLLNLFDRVHRRLPAAGIGIQFTECVCWVHWVYCVLWVEKA